MRTPRPLTRPAAIALTTVTAAAATVAAIAGPATTDPAPAAEVQAADAAAVRPLPPLTSQAAFDAEVEQLKARAPQPEPEPEPAPAPDHTHEAAAPAAPAVATGSVWDRLAMCESSGDWSSSVGTYEGGLQFHPQTWDAYKPAGFPEAAYQASREQQIQVAEYVLADQGWGAWPACSRKLGLR